MKIAIRYIFIILSTCALMVSCAKEYSSETPLVPDASWQFSQGALNFAGPITSVYSTNGGSSNLLMLTGNSNDGKQAFQITVYADSIQTGTYKASAYQCSFIYGSSTNPIYQAGGSYGEEFIVNITKFQSKSVSGNFSGIAQDSAGNSVTISNGQFHAQ